MADRSTNWSITINNPTPDDEECISVARSKGWTVNGQKETGSEGTPHYQLAVKTPQVRFTAVKKVFPRAHIEIARNIAALNAYVKKEETRTGELPTTSSQYPTISRMWELMFDMTWKESWYGEDSMDEYIEEYSKMSDKARLVWLDDKAADMIKRGYFIEHHIVNPQVRSSFSKFMPQLFERTIRKLITSVDTSRQTDTQEIVVPTINATEAPSQGTPEGSEGEEESSSGSEDESDEEFSESEYQEI
nr:MAG: replication associated protein [Cressdnaviricota sp.]